MIYYYCPNHEVKSAGVRILLRHVEILVRHGIKSALLLRDTKIDEGDAPQVPICRLAPPAQFRPQDVLVIPEGCMQTLHELRAVKTRKFMIALNWRYMIQTMHGFPDWRAYGIEGVLTHSPFIGDCVEWSMRLPTHVFHWGIREDLYHRDSPAKEARIVTIERKAQDGRLLHRIVGCRNVNFVNRIQWRALDGLSESDYAAEIRRARLFLNLSYAEGLPCSLLEAMRSGTLVCGYNSVGGQRELIGAGPEQNCVLAENLDVVTLAQRIEPYLLDLLQGDCSGWEGILQNAYQTSNPYRRDREENSVLELWRSLAP